MKNLQAVLGSSFLNGQAISESVYSIVTKVEGAMSATKATLVEWNARSQGRKALGRLSIRMLEDIGLEPYQAKAEINKPFWKK